MSTKGERTMCGKINCGCPIIIAIAIILGIVIGILFFNAVIVVGIPALAVVLIFGALALGILALIAGLGKSETAKCVCQYGNCIVLGGVLSIILPVIGLLVTLATASVGIAILIGAIAAAFIITLISLVLFLLCLVRSNCRCKIECRD